MSTTAATTTNTNSDEFEVILPAMTSLTITPTESATVPTVEQEPDQSFLKVPTDDVPTDGIQAEKTAVAIIDVSGSTQGNMGATGKSVRIMELFDLAQACATDGVKKVFVIFFASDACCVPFPLNADFASLQTALLASANNLSKIGGSTATWRGFELLNQLRTKPGGWNSKNVYLSTDGEIDGDSTNRLGNAIKALLTDTAVKLTIITTESRNRDLANTAETNAAGCDVLEIIKKQGLGKRVFQFISHTLNHDWFIQLQNPVVPAGFAPFKDKIFSVRDADKFYDLMAFLVKKSAQNPEELFDIVNEMSKALEALTRDMRIHMVDQVVNRYCNLFEGTALSTEMIRYMLDQSIMSVKQGEVMVVAQFRRKMTNLFKEASGMLASNWMRATGMSGSGKVVSLLIPSSTTAETVVLVCPSRMVDQAFGVFNSAAVLVDGKIVPVLPFVLSGLDMARQCTRQAIRAVIASSHTLQVSDNKIVGVVLGQMLRVVKSDADVSVKTAFQNMARLMLEKKRTNEDVTELDFLRAGNFSADVMKFGSTVGQETGLTLRDGTLLYACYLALSDGQLVQKQLSHCLEDIKVDFPGLTDPANLLDQLTLPTPPVKMVTVSELQGVSYFDVVTQEDVSATGGWLLKGHTHNNLACDPKLVFSQAGYDTLQSFFKCPVCYKPLSFSDFEKVGPKPPMDIVNIVNHYANIPTATNTGNQNRQGNNRPNTAAGSNRASSSYASSSAPIVTKSATDFYIILKGEVGAGKTTSREVLKAALEAKGYKVLIISSDDHRKLNKNVSQTENAIRNDLNAFARTNSSNKKVVIVDTCGENWGETVFGYNFQTWNRLEFYPNMVKDVSQMTPAELKQRQAWTIRNVLNRTIPSGSNTPYWLNATIPNAIKVITDVHRQKFTGVFPGKSYALSIPAGSNRDQTLAKINADADAYTRLLANYPMQTAVDAFLAQANL